MSKPKVSVIVPVYNVEKYLDRCVQSIRNQTLRDIEVILVDDGSPDKCPAMCDEYARLDSRIKVIHKQNAGLGMACNSGLEVATGEYVAFCDSDDWVDVNCYEQMYKTAIDNGSDAVYTGIKRIDQSGKVTLMSQPEGLANYNKNELKGFIYDMIASESTVKIERKRQMSAKIVLYSNEIIRDNDVRFKSEREYISEDLLFNMDFIQYCNRVTELPMTFYYYFVNSDSLTNALRKDRFEKNLSLRNFLIDNYPCYNTSPQYVQRVDRMFIGYTRSVLSIIVNSNLSKAHKLLQIKQICENGIWKQLEKTYPIKDMPFFKRIVFSLLNNNNPSFLYHLYSILHVKIGLKRMLTKFNRGVKLSLIPSFLYDKVLSYFYRKSFKSCGMNVYLRPTSSDFKGLENMSIGNNVSIPKGAVFYSTEAQLTIKDNVIFGPRPTIITGDHRIDVIGVPIIDSHDKLPENDKDVTIEEDVWVGANVVILKGVTIGRGSVVAAGAIVNKSCPPYSIIGGIPAKVLKYRFSVDEALEHESKLYSLENQYSKIYIEQSRI